MRHRLAGLMLAAVSFSASAADNLVISLGNLGNGDWHASGIELKLALGDENDQYQIRVDEIRHPALPDTIKAFTYHCRSGSIGSDSITCRDGRADLQMGNLKQQDLRTRIDINLKSQSIELKVNNIKISGGVLAAALQYEQSRWRLALDASNLQLSRLGALVPDLQGAISEFSLSAQADLKAVLQGRGGRLSEVSSTLEYRKLRFSGPAGEYLGEGLAGRLKAKARSGQGAWSGQQQLSIDSGEMLTPHFYLSATERPVTLETGFNFRPQPGRLRLQGLQLDHRDRISLRGAAEWTLGDDSRLTRLHLTSPPSSLDHLFNAYLLPVLTQPFLQQIRLEGLIGFDLDYSEERSELALTLKDTTVEQGSEGSQPFRLSGIDADLHWSSLASAPESRISWQSGRLFKEITMGPGTLRLQIAGKQLSLLEEATVGILDGSLRTEQFALEQGPKGPRVTFQGYLTPISMQAISQALGWPSLSGQLSGMIPAIAYENEVIVVDGVALVKLFGGDILIRNLRLDDLFGALPALDADLEFKNIDLETLTRTFSFGKITGKLSGRVDELRMEDWVPVSFDARFATPEGDESRHRISQKAVDNISNLGGSGVSGAISRSFLRFFEEFGYDRLGISCRLQQGVCEMDGIEQAERGYYLVKGGGIPRIDIIGFNRRTDWAVLVSKLKQIVEGGPPVIE
ncbi:MAG: YdbH domain-containing protein [Sedimenticola sp.]|nr:YdbH domain-containing protein [Sedimenticola sp.]